MKRALGLMLAWSLAWSLGDCWADPELLSPPQQLPSNLKKQELNYSGAPLLALANNPRLAVSLAQVRESLARVELAAAAGRPQTLLGLQGPPIPTGGDGNFRNDYVLSPIRVEFRQLIYDGGRILSQVQQGKALARQSAWQAQADWQDLYFQVRKAYLGHLTRQGEVELARQQVELAQEQLRQSQIRYQVGKAPRGDVLTAELPVAEAELEVEQKLLAAQKSLGNLNQLLGLDLETPLELAPPPLPVQTLPDLEVCLQEAQKRPILLALEQQVQASQRQIEAGERDNAPQVNILAGAAAVSQGEQILSGPQYRGGFEMLWQFGDGGRATHLAEIGRATRERSEAQLKEQRRKVELEVRQAYAELATSVRVHRTQKVRVHRSRESLRIAQAQYRAGVVNLYAVRQAQTDLKEAQQAENQAFYDYFLALAQLDLACGRSGAVPLSTPWPQEDLSSQERSLAAGC